jgi:hypothetical protein
VLIVLAKLGALCKRIVCKRTLKYATGFLTTLKINIKVHCTEFMVGAIAKHQSQISCSEESVLKGK